MASYFGLVDEEQILSVDYSSCVHGIYSNDYLPHCW